MKDISWKEFCYLVAGLGPETPLGRLVSIRSETDKDTLKRFTPEMRKERNRWLSKRAVQKEQRDVDRFLEEMLEGFKSLSGGRHTAPVEG